MTRARPHSSSLTPHDPSNPIDTFVTGGSGFIGRWLLAELTRRGRRVGVLLRRACERAPELRAFVQRLGGDPAHLIFFDGDLEQEGLSLGPAAESDLRGVRDVFHLAARFEFRLEATAARRANVDGTRHVFEFAATRPELARVVLLGGYRLTRPPVWLQTAAYPFDPAVSARLYRELGAYEASKHESYRLAKRYESARGLPVTYVHPSTVIGDSRTGETTQVAGLGELMEQLHDGVLPALVGPTDAFVPIVAVDYLAEFLATVPRNQDTLGADLTVLANDTPVLPELVRAAAAHLGVATPRLTLPKGLVAKLPRAFTGVEPETLTFLSSDRYETAAAEAHAAAAALTMPPTELSMRRWLDGLLASRFTRLDGRRHGELRDGIFARGRFDGQSGRKLGRALYLHGLPWNADAWEDVASAVGVPGTSVDLPGLGRSHPSDASVDGDAERLASWMRSHPDGPSDSGGLVLVGHSYGAMVALALAEKSCERARGLVLVAPPFLQSPAPWPQRLPRVVGRALRRMDASTLAARLAPGLPKTHPALSSAAADLRRPGVARRVGDRLRRAADARVRKDARERLERLVEGGLPVRILVGERDPLLEAPPIGVIVETVRGAGHAPHLTHPEVTARVIGQALRSEEVETAPFPARKNTSSAGGTRA